VLIIFVVVMIIVGCNFKLFEDRLVALVSALLWGDAAAAAAALVPIDERFAVRRGILKNRRILRRRR
jgi:drug/metabolite transporter (DMT)-like permease